MKSKTLSILIMAVFTMVIISCQPETPIYQSSTYVYDAIGLATTTVTNGVKGYTVAGDYVKIVFGKTEITVETIPVNSTTNPPTLINASYNTTTYSIDSENKLSPLTTSTTTSTTATRVYTPVIKSMTVKNSAGTVVTTYGVGTTGPVFTFTYNATYGYVLTYGTTTLYPKK